MGNSYFICRSLEVFYKYDRTHSSIINEQKSVNGGSYLGGPLRLKSCLIFWLQCDQAGIVFLVIVSEICVALILKYPLL